MTKPRTIPVAKKITKTAGDIHAKIVKEQKLLFLRWQKQLRAGIFLGGVNFLILSS
ncbi:MAG: hypothetical protein ABSG99_01595 [Sedimentisphaerales bacterium]